MENLRIEDDDEWHKEEGVPRLTDPFIQQYLTGRDALVAQEKARRSGAHLYRLRYEILR
jgi:hypothetical protein